MAMDVSLRQKDCIIVRLLGQLAMLIEKADGFASGPANPDNRGEWFRRRGIMIFRPVIVSAKINIRPWDDETKRMLIMPKLWKILMKYSEEIIKDK